MYRDSTIAHAHRDGKNCAIPACHRDSSLALNRDNQPDGIAGNANSLNCRAVGCKAQCDYNTMIADTQARVWEPSYKANLTLPNTCFYAILS
jgi:hypothetical protein